MPSVRQPRSGSMQYWPRKRAKNERPRIRTFPKVNEPGLLAFSGYKVGMTHMIAIETNKHSHKKGEEISIPVTIVECPPMKIFSARFYKNQQPKKEILLSNDKQLTKTLKTAKKTKTVELDKIDSEEFDDLRIVVYTQPGLTSIGKKKPEMFEVSLGGNFEDKLKFVKENLNKDIYLNTVFSEGDIIDVKSVTKGKGFQGPVKRFGISIRQAKSEKAIRNPGSLGPWKAQGKIMWRVAHAGKMGYHQRTENNKQILKIYDDSKDLVQEGGFLKYGNIKNQAILIKGSISGSKKRLVILEKPVRSKKQKALPTLVKVNTSSKQGN